MPASTASHNRDLGFLYSLWRHKGKVLLWSACVMGLSALAIVYLPKSYASSAKIYLRLGRESVTLDPSATTGKTVEIQDSRENQVTSTREMLYSWSLLEYVVDQIGPEVIIKDEPANAADANSPVVRAIEWLSVLDLTRPVSPREQAATKLYNSMYIDTEQNSSVIEVTFTAKSPKLAQRILETYLDECQRHYVTANRTVGTLEFFTDQSAELKKRLEDANVALRDAKNAGSLVSIVAEQQAVQKQLGDVETQVLGAESAIVASKAAIENFQKTLELVPERFDLATTNGFPNQAADNMRQEFYKMQIATWGLETKLGHDHPLVVAAREQLKHSEEILDVQPLQRVQTTEGINPVHQSINLELRREEVKLAALQAKSQTLNEQYAALRTRVRELNEGEIRLAELERNVDLATNTYRSYVEHREQARIAHELAASQISNLNVVQAPTFIEKPDSPRPFTVLGVGLAISVLGGIALVFTCDMVEQSQKPREVAAHPSVRHDWISAKPAKHYATVEEPVEHEELVNAS